MTHTTVSPGRASLTPSAVPRPVPSAPLQPRYCRKGLDSKRNCLIGVISETISSTMLEDAGSARCSARNRSAGGTVLHAPGQDLTLVGRPAVRAALWRRRELAAQSLREPTEVGLAVARHRV